MQEISDKTQQQLITRMLTPSFYNHPVDAVKLVETHISWVFLAGNFAYKLKKPVNFGFLDFSTVEKRRYFCYEELRLNSHFAPHIYLDVVQIGGSPDNPTLDQDPPIDYVVKMRRFPQSQQLDRMLDNGLLTTEHLCAFAQFIAQVHNRCAIADNTSEYGSSAMVMEPIMQNFVQIRHLQSSGDILDRINMLETWGKLMRTKLRDLLIKRKDTGFIRECHGDFHLANMAWFDGGPVVFDCIEFSPNLRWIDVINDIAFLAMDLDDHEQAPNGWRFINRYLQISGDYGGVPLLNFYKVYRALVRAKVLCLRLSQAGLDKEERHTNLSRMHSYLGLAGQYILPTRAPLLITHGLSGSGKTVFVNQLAAHCKAISLHSDLERKRLHNLAETACSGSPVNNGIYSEAAGKATYDRLYAYAETILQAGIPVIVDATFLKKELRYKMMDLAAQLGSSFIILDFQVADEELRRRVLMRLTDPKCVSEADEQVLELQMKTQEELSEQERRFVIPIDAATNPVHLAHQIMAV